MSDQPMHEGEMECLHVLSNHKFVVKRRFYFWRYLECSGCGVQITGCLCNMTGENPNGMYCPVHKIHFDTPKTK